MAPMSRLNCGIARELWYPTRSCFPEAVRGRNPLLIGNANDPRSVTWIDRQERKLLLIPLYGISRHWGMSRTDPKLRHNDSLACIVRNPPPSRCWCIFAVSALLFVIVFGAQYIQHFAAGSGPLKALAILIVNIGNSPSEQWWAVACFCLILLGILLLHCELLRKGPKKRARGTGARFRREVCTREAVLVIFIGLSATAYTLRYESAYAGAAFLSLLLGITFGRGIGTHELWRMRYKHQESTAPIIATSLISVLAIVAICHPDMRVSFQYRGHDRWIGPFVNPNTFGQLMGAGGILGIGLLLSTAGRRERRSRKSSEHGGGSWGKCCIACPSYIIISCVLFYALINSYSRSAWVGTFLALMYLCGAWSFPHYWGYCNSLNKPGNGMRLPVSSCLRWGSAILTSLGIVLFWAFREIDHQVVRRVFSIANPNDFSGANRLAAATGAFQMMGERPMSGFGWNTSERIYNDYYRAPEVFDHLAIQTNSYLAIGTTAGLLGLGCFLGYLWLSMTGRPLSGSFFQHTASVQSPRFGIETAFRAGALVLIVGFFFDGGLFRLATGATFWMLLEFGASRERAPNPLRCTK